VRRRRRHVADAAAAAAQQSKRALPLACDPRVAPPADRALQPSVDDPSDDAQRCARDAARRRPRARAAEPEVRTL
jgi:hypothetical protein